VINPLKLNVIYGSLINLFFHLLNAIFFFFEEYRRQRTEAEELRLINSQAQLQLIRSQINPHFLFNNLNVLSGMVIKDNPDANKFIEEFSKVYRYVLNNQDKELVELRSELEFIHPYLFLLNKRFDQGLKVAIEIPDHYKTWHVVPAALQMLIENAIKHNVVSRSRPLRIDIRVNGNNTLIVRNNLQPRHISEPSTRIGLQNIMKRYELISGRTVIVRRTEQEFEVTLPLLHLN
jgi:LytS/YehU family sensor histidine kinase